MRWPRRITFVLFLAALFGYEAFALFVQESGTSSNIPPARDLHLTTELRGPDAFLRQAFVVHADGFTAIEVYPRQSEHPPSGPMRIRLYDLGFSNVVWTPITEEFHDAAKLDLSAPLRLVIPRMDQSAGRAFILEIYLPHAPPGHGLRFEAGGPTYAYGELVLGGQRQWGDLKFRTEAQRTTIFHNVRRLRHTLPGPMQTDLFLVAALLVGNWALATMIYGLAFAPIAEDGGGDDGRQLPNGSAGITADQPRV